MLSEVNASKWSFHYDVTRARFDHTCSLLTHLIAICSAVTTETEPNSILWFPSCHMLPFKSFLSRMITDHMRGKCIRAASGITTQFTLIVFTAIKTIKYGHNCSCSILFSIWVEIYVGMQCKNRCNNNYANVYTKTCKLNTCINLNIYLSSVFTWNVPCSLHALNILYTSHW